VTGEPVNGRRHERLLLALVAGLSEVIINWLTHGMAGDVEDLADDLTVLCLAVLNALQR
jgi:hypothetical protein